MDQISTSLEEISVQKFLEKENEIKQKLDKYQILECGSINRKI